MSGDLGEHGRLVETGDGLLHITRNGDATLCGKPIESYPLDPDMMRRFGCESCLAASGIPRWDLDEREQQR